MGFPPPPGTGIPHSNPQASHTLWMIIWRSKAGVETSEATPGVGSVVPSCTGWGDLTGPKSETPTFVGAWVGRGVRGGARRPFRSPGDPHRVIPGDRPQRSEGGVMCLVHVGCGSRIRRTQGAAMHGARHVVGVFSVEGPLSGHVLRASLPGVGESTRVHGSLSSPGPSASEFGRFGDPGESSRSLRAPWSPLHRFEVVRGDRSRGLDSCPTWSGWPARVDDDAPGTV